MESQLIGLAEDALSTIRALAFAWIIGWTLTKIITVRYEKRASSPDEPNFFHKEKQ